MLNTKLIDVDGIANEILSVSFPINKIEVFFDNLDHSNFLGFTWERVGAGKVPVGLDTSDTDFNAIGKTGGEKTHTLTIDEMPSHYHTAEYQGNYGTAGAFYGVATNSGSSGGNVRTQSTGGGHAHNNLQPYIVMAFWKRTA